MVESPSLRQSDYHRYDNLLQAACKAIKSRYRPNWHTIGCAVEMSTGQIHVSVHLDAYVGRAAVCAEPLAIGAARTEEPNATIVAVVAVRHPAPQETNQTIRIVSPCGACREVLRDFAPDAKIVLLKQGNPTICRGSDLLPKSIQEVEGLHDG